MQKYKHKTIFLLVKFEHLLQKLQNTWQQKRICTLQSDTKKGTATTLQSPLD